MAILYKKPLTQTYRDTNSLTNSGHILGDYSKQENELPNHLADEPTYESPIDEEKKKKQAALLTKLKRGDVTPEEMQTLLGKGKEFFTYYFNSPKFEERYAKEEANFTTKKRNYMKYDVDEDNLLVPYDVAKKDSTNNVKKTTLRTPSAATLKTKYNPTGVVNNFNPVRQLITMTAEPDKNKTYTKEGVLIHELGHAAYNYDQKTKLLKNHIVSLQNTDTDRTAHDKDAMETVADLASYRYMAKQLGIYDAGKEDFTQEHMEAINKLLKGTFVNDRLMRLYNNKNLIWLMNNVAQNEDKQKDGTMIA